MSLLPAPRIITLDPTVLPKLKAKREEGPEKKSRNEEEVEKYGSGDEVITPPWLKRYMASRFNFTLDVAADHVNRMCPIFITKKQDALTVDWRPHGGWVWCNPPYTLCEEFIRKATLEHEENGINSVLLLPVRTDRPWFHKYVIPVLHNVEWYRGRVWKGMWGLHMNVVFGPQGVEIEPSIDCNKLRGNEA